MRWMRGLTLFIAGTVLGIFMTQPSAAPQEKVTGLRLNHFGIYVKDLDESMNFYTKTMGFREAFSVKDKDGKPTIVYLQISRDTFLELAPASADRPVGFSHVGIWADDLKTTVTSLRQQGVWSCLNILLNRSRGRPSRLGSKRSRTRFLAERSCRARMSVLRSQFTEKWCP